MEKLRELFLRDILSIALLIMSCAVLAAAFNFQPKVSDDWHLLWQYQRSNGVADFWVGQYLGWSGSFLPIVLAALISPHPAIEAIYRPFIAVEILLLISLAWYCAVGPTRLATDKGFPQSFLIFGALLWLSLPVRSETVSWLTGNLAYLVPAIIGLAFIAWSKQSLSNGRYPSEGNSATGILISSVGFVIGFLAGSSQLQIISACVVYTIASLYRILVNEGLRTISRRYWVSVGGLVVGSLIFVAAPGNYVRLGQIDGPSIVEIVERMVLFVPGAYFEIGTGGTGKSIWLGIVILFLSLFNPSLPITKERLRIAGVWILVSLATLLALLPATNYISPRTSFFAVIFLYIAIVSLLCEKESVPRQPPLSVVLFVVSLLVLAESLSGLIANVSVSSEFNNRWSIINANHSGEVAVPFIATQPSPLTYIQTPEHDRMFLGALSEHLGLKVVHDVSETAPLPNSLSPLKTIKYRHR